MCQNIRLAQEVALAQMEGHMVHPQHQKGREARRSTAQHSRTQARFTTKSLYTDSGRTRCLRATQAPSDCDTTNLPTFQCFKIGNSLWELNHRALIVVMIWLQATHSHEISASSSVKRRKWTRSWPKLLLSLGIQFCMTLLAYIQLEFII